MNSCSKSEKCGSISSGLTGGGNQVEADGEQFVGPVEMLMSYLDCELSFQFSIASFNRVGGQKLDGRELLLDSQAVGDLLHCR